MWCSSTYKDNLELKIFISVTADSSLRSPTGGVEVLCTTPHIYEQKTAAQQWLRHEQA